MFDTPVFKILAPNDTGERPGHQGGIVIPKGIEEFFPDIVGAISAKTPTADVELLADLIVDGRLVEKVRTRYQYQTWGGTRSPERRLTANLGALRNVARGGDIALFSRDLDSPDRMQISLIRQGSADHTSILAANPLSRWGVVSNLPAPASNAQLRTAQREIDALQAADFSLIDANRPVLESFTKRKARNAVFRKKLLSNYGAICQATGEFIVSPKKATNVDAAHIVPVEMGGTDDIRNGILLSKDLHWAFDLGLFGISDDYRVIVPDRHLNPKTNLPLSRIAGRNLQFGNSALRPHVSALEWHRVHRLGG